MHLGGKNEKKKMKFSTEKESLTFFFFFCSESIPMNIVNSMF